MKKLSLRKAIYNRDSVENVIRVYKDYARMVLKDDNDYWIVLFDRCVLDEDKTVKEFENYLIAVENS